MPSLSLLFTALLALTPAAHAQGEARDLALDAFSAEFYREGVSASPTNLAKMFQDACDRGYNPACRRSSWLVDGRADLAKAQESLTPSCESDDPVACLVAGWAFEDQAARAAVPEEKDRYLKRATRNYKVHCDTGFTRACHDYAGIIFREPSLGADPRAAVKRWQDACLGGVPASCDALANLYNTGGPSVRPDRRTALSYAQRACDAGYPQGCATLGALEDKTWDATKLDTFYGGLCEDGHRDSCWKLARTYFDGIHPEPSEGRAQQLFATACDLGHARACYETGRHHGEGQATDDAKAAEYYKRACDLGAAAGCSEVVGMMLAGRASGNLKDSQRAFELACEERESAAACNVLGQALIEGVDVPRNAERGRALLKRACTDERSDPTACFNLGMAFEEGLGGDRDRTEASRFYRWSCINGHAGACDRRGDLLSSDVGVRRDDHEALNMYERACEAKNAPACRKGGLILQEATYVTKDLAKAELLYRAACDGQDHRGCDGLGQVYELGVNGSPDMAAARAAYEEAIAAGSIDARRRLSRLLWNGFGGKKDKGRAKKLASEACQSGDAIACRGPAFL